MLRIKIGDTPISVQEIDIPVVLKSPLFTQSDKIEGSFLFAFTLPYTDELKKEFGFAHRPEVTGNPTLKKDCEIHFGPIHYAGKATITDFNDTEIEMSVPIDSGDMAAIMKGKTLQDIPLNDEIVLDPKISITKVAILYETYEEHLDPFLLIMDINTDKIVLDRLGIFQPATYSYKIPASGSYKISAIINLDIKFALTRTFTVLKNGVLLDSQQIEPRIGEPFGFYGFIYSEDHSLNANDIITFKLNFESSPLAGWMGTAVKHAANVVVLSGTSIVIDNGETPFADIISGTYPDVNYAVMPINNPLSLQNIPDSLYQIDLSNEKENHQNFATYINYFINGKFPWVIIGSRAYAAYAIPNIFAPYPYVAAIMDKLLTLVGYNAVNNVWQSASLSNLLLIHNKIINTYFNDQDLTLSDFMPDKPLSDFFREVCAALGVVFNINSNKKTIEFSFIDDIINNQDYIEYSENVPEKPSLKVIPRNGYAIIFEPPKCDYIKDFARSLDEINIKGTVDYPENLPVSAEINDAYYVNSRKAWWKFNYDAESSTRKWVHHSIDHILELKDTDTANSDEPFTIKLPTNTLAMDFYHPEDGPGDKTIGAENRYWLTPAWFIPCNFDFLPDEFLTDDEIALLFYYGMQQDSQGNTYPFASSGTTDRAGTQISDKALTMNGDFGLYEKRLKKFIDFILNSPGEYTITKNITPVEAANINFFKWHRIFGVDYLFKEIRFNIYREQISPAQIIALRRYLQVPDSNDPPPPPPPGPSYRVTASLPSTINVLQDDIEPFTETITPGFSVITANPNNELNTTGTLFTSGIDTQAILVFNITSTIISGIAYFNVYKNGTLLTSKKLTTGLVVINKAATLATGDEITWNIEIYSPGSGPTWNINYSIRNTSNISFYINGEE